MFKHLTAFSLAAALSLACSDDGHRGNSHNTIPTTDMTATGTATTGSSSAASSSTTSAATSAAVTSGVTTSATISGVASTANSSSSAGGFGGATGTTTSGSTTMSIESATSDVASTSNGASTTGGGTTMEWLPSWATTIQTTEPNNMPPSLVNNTLRQFVWPTVSGSEIRIQLSNEKGATPVEIQKVHIAMAKTGSDPGNSMGQIDTATDAAFSFGGMQNVTIPAGETIWSDSLGFPLAEIELTAITMQFGSSVPSAITGHPGARTTSYVANGDAVNSEGMTGESRDRWYFINAIEVMAPANAYAIAVLGDSITDGYGVLNVFGRWPDFMTLKIQDDVPIGDTRSVLNFGMGANNLTQSSEYQDAGMLRFERDVLKREKIKWLIVLEGINDIIGNVPADDIIGAYQQIIQKAHEKGILVYGSPLTPSDQGSTTVRDDINEWIRTSGEFDAVIELDKALDPYNTGAIASEFKRDDGDGLHPSIVGYEAMGNAVDLSLFYDDTLE